MSSTTGGVCGVILAAGKGTRAYPYSQRIPKAMLDICARPLLRYTLDIMRDRLGIRDVVIVVSDSSRILEKEFGDGAALGLNIRWADNHHVEKGPVYSLLAAEPLVETDQFVVMLSDELYFGSNHDELLRSDFRNADITVAARPSSLTRDIRKNYSVDVEGNRVTSVIEKPSNPTNRLLGCGTYIFRRSIFRHIREGFAANHPSVGNLTALIAERLRNGETVNWFALSGAYINVNYQHDVDRARSLARRALVPKPRISLIMPCLHMTPTLDDVLRETTTSQLANEIILVTPEKSSALEHVAATYGVSLISLDGEERGLTQLIRRGIDLSTGDVIALVMPDGSFEISDLGKLLNYAYDAEMVLGTRTTRQLIEQGANMDTLARLGSYFLAKLVEVLWISHKVRLTDVGCIYRIFWRYSYNSIVESTTATRGEFLLDMVIEMMLRRFQIIELPIRYCSVIEERSLKFEERNFNTAIRILSLILAKKYKAVFGAPA